VEEMQPEKLAHRVEFEKVLRGKKLVLWVRYHWYNHLFFSKSKITFIRKGI
jgi:hypothetical protein